MGPTTRPLDVMDQSRGVEPAPPDRQLRIRLVIDEPHRLQNDKSGHQNQQEPRGLGEIACQPSYPFIRSRISLTHSLHTSACIHSKSALGNLQQELFHHVKP